jgi:hypothetical protein
MFRGAMPRSFAQRYLKFYTHCPLVGRKRARSNATCDDYEGQQRC